MNENESTFLGNFPTKIYKEILQTVPGSHLFTFVKNRYQIDFNALRFHRFFSHKFCGFSVNFIDKTPNFNDLVEKSHSCNEISL